MPFTQPTVLPSPPSYSTPSHSDLAAVAATVSVVGVLMAVLLTWLVFRLRRASNAQSQSIPISVSVSSRPAPTFTFPSFISGETGSKFGFIRKPGRPTHQHKEASWDFVDPDPFSCPKERPLDMSPPTPLPKHRPVPLTSVPAYTARASMRKDELGPRTPTTPASVVEPPPPAYCPHGSSWLPYQPGVFSPA